MDKIESISTPMHPSQVLEADEDGEKVFDKLYRVLIGSLLYLVSSNALQKPSYWFKPF